MLMRFELQKLYSKRSNLIVLLLLLALIGYSSYQAIRSVEWVDTQGNWETGYSAAKKLQQAKAEWSGTLDQELLGKGLDEIKRIYSSIDSGSSNIEENWIVRSQLQGVQEIADLLSWSYAETYGSFEKMVVELQAEDLLDFYENRIGQRKAWLYDESSWAYYNYTEQEKQYIVNQYASMEVPLQLSYHEGWVQANEQLPSLLKYGIILLSFLYYISFTDGQGIFHKQEISMELYAAFNGFELDDISLMNEASRHLTEVDTGELPLDHRIADSSEPVEDHVYRRIMYQELHKAIAQLPEIQRRRVLLYYFGGYTYEQIAEIEGCKHPAIIKSVASAEKNIKKFLSK